MDNSMMKFICGCAVGIFLATEGTSGIAMLIDSSVSKFQNTIKESVREQPRQHNQQMKMESI
jgi:hypothetical protein